MSTTERLNIPNTINWLNSMELRDIARELGFLSAENEALQTTYEALTAEAFARSTRLATVESENEALRAQVEALTSGREAIAEAAVVAANARKGLEGLREFLPDASSPLNDEVLLLRAQVETLTDGLICKEAALIEWFDKTDWVSKTAKPSELGKHRADVLRERVEALKKVADSLPWYDFGTRPAVREVGAAQPKGETP